MKHSPRDDRSEHETRAAGLSRHDRRAFLRRSLAAAAAALPAIEGSGAALGAASGGAPVIERIETRIISLDGAHYHGWPTLLRRRNGELVVVCSGGRRAHVCPFGRVEMIRSRDDGGTWSWPRVLLDSAIDDRDAGIVETHAGTLVVTTFTSLAFEPSLAKAPPEWRAAADRLTPGQRRAELGQWVLRSEDGGITWSPRLSCPVNSPHGPIALADGRLLYPGKELWTGEGRIGACESRDDGRTWSWLATIPTREGDDPKDYHELHAVEADDGTLVCLIRNHNAANDRELLQTVSSDGGATWSTPAATGIWGLPPHLLRRRDGSLLLTYGHRRAPLGNQARISTDHGATWSAPVILSDDGITGDLGYPSTVELEDGTLLTVWYEVRPESAMAVLRQLRWRLRAAGR